MSKKKKREPAEEWVCGEEWWDIDGETIMSMLWRVYGGESPDLVYAEMYANSDVEIVDGK